MASRQDLVKTQKRAVVKLGFNNESAAYNLGVTGSLFDPIGGTTGEAFVRGITNNTAALSRIIWTASTGGYNLTWAGTAGATAFMAYGTDGVVDFERMTMINNATTPTGILTITPTTALTGTLILEVVQNSGSVTPPGYFSL